MNKPLIEYYTLRLPNVLLTRSAGIKQFKIFNKINLVRNLITNVKTREASRTSKLQKQEENNIIKI